MQLYKKQLLYLERCGVPLKKKTPGEGDPPGAGEC